MSQLNIDVDCEGTPVTVRDMRKRLAKMLSGLDGSQMVVYSFRASLPFYRPAPEEIVPLELSAEESTALYLLRNDSDVLPRIADPTMIYGELSRPEND